MIYMLERNGWLYFNRRVPEAYRSRDTRNVVRHALKTKDKRLGLRLAIAKNDELEAYWNTLAETGQNHSPEQYTALVERSRLLGFPYYPNQQVAQLPLQQLINRLLHVQKEDFNEVQTEAVLGKVSVPAIRVSQVLQRYFDLAKDKTLNKSPDQIRKWKNPRKKAVSNFIKCVGNKPLDELTRADAIKFRDWWIARIKNENLVAVSANKELINIKVIISAVAEELKLDIDTSHIFKSLLLKDEEEGTRMPFETSFIVSTLLNPEKLKGLNEQARWILHAFSETGAGLTELTGLLPEDIILDADIPHIHIRPRKGCSLKTKYRKRVIPLVGYALDAFNACPDGFTNYHDRPDVLSNVLGKYLRENKIMPSERHTVYSLRHSFQDRLLAVNTPDRIQADLMGHKFSRPRYGEGATLQHKLEYMLKVQLKPKES